jgi:hypothetical protein
MTEFNAQRVIDILLELQLKSGNVSSILENLIKSGNTPSTISDTGVPIFTVRSTIPTVTTSGDNNYQPLKTDNTGRLHVSTDPLELLRVIRLADTPNVGDVTYYRGWALPGTAPGSTGWRVARTVETASGNVTTTYAGGTLLPNFVFNNYLSLVYS